MAPEDEAALAELLASADGPLRIAGGGTRPIGRPVRGRVLTTRRLSGVSLYEPGALTLVVGAGTPLAEVEALLAAEGQRLPFEPMDHRGLLGTTGEPTIGGVAAANVSGPRRVRAGACRDFLLGVRFVDGTGTVVRSGGRVMKNVTGYDLVRLMAGSFGTLGVLTEVAFKVLPAPELAATLAFEGLDLREAVLLMTRALASPWEVSGAAHVPGADGTFRTLLRLEGFADSVHYRAGRLAERLSGFGAPETDTEPASVAATWREVRDVGPFHEREGDVWRISVKGTDAPEVAERFPEASFMFDWGGGLVWALVPPGTELRARLDGIPGHATLVRADATTRERIAPFPPEPAAVATLSEGLRRKFDPRGILNPGLMT
ncbi:MAG: FAD-binding protein [Alphaproteobacteria bacterium]|nr:MAG: FAD-binding protein [Alphaproteobacteria bacterium]